MMGNLRVGSTVRGVASYYTTRKQVNLKNVILISPPLILGTIFGAKFISQINMSYGFIIILLAALTSEFVDKIKASLNTKSFSFAAFLLGVYYGIFGAGVGVLLVTLLKIKTPDDSKIAEVKSDVRAVELAMSSFAVITHFMSGNVISSLCVPWSLGALLGGYAGGKLLTKIGRLSGEIQKIILRVSYIFAVLVVYFQAF